MDKELERLLKKAHNYVMTPEELQAQRKSWVRSSMLWPKPRFTMEMRNGVLTKVYASYEDYCNG